MQHQWLEIQAQAAVAADCGRIQDEMAAVARSIGTRPLFLTGSGDSYFAGLAVQPLARRLLGEQIIPVSAAMFSRYACWTATAESAVIAISMSGNAARTREAALAAQRRNLLTVGLTNSKTGALATEVGRVVQLGLPEGKGWTPGTLTYFGSVLALIFLCVEMARLRDPDVTNLERALAATLSQVPEALALAEQPSKRLAATLARYNTPPYYILGGGPNYATAKYTAAKFFETYAALAIGRDLEEFAHQEWWVLQKTNPVFVLAIPGPSFSRARELLEAAREFGSTVVPISPDPTALGLTPLALPLPPLSGGTQELLSPLVCPIPLQMTAYHLTALQGMDPDDRTHVDPFRKQVSRRLTRGSRILSGSEQDDLA